MSTFISTMLVLLILLFVFLLLLSLRHGCYHQADRQVPGMTDRPRSEDQEL